MAHMGTNIHNYSKSTKCSKVNLQVLLDMDQVLCDFETPFLNGFKKQYPDEPCVELEDRDGIMLSYQYERLKPGLPAKCATIYNAEGFFKSLPEIPGAVAAAKELMNMEGVDVFLCTSPVKVYKYCVREKFEWVEEHLGQHWIERIILTRDKTMVNGHLLIDDNVNITGTNKNPSWEHVVFSAFHNVRADLGDRRKLECWTDGKWRDLIEEFKKKICLNIG